MNIYALLLLCSLSTAIAIPFYTDYQLEDPNSPTDLLASDPVYAPGTSDSFDVQYISSDSLTSSDSLKLFSPNPPSAPAATQPQQNDADKTPPVPESTVGDDVCCEPKSGAEKQVCHKRTNAICYPNDLYNCPDGYSGDLNVCTKLEMNARKEPSWPNPMDFIWLGGICFQKPKPALCPEFFNNLPGFGGR